MQTKQTKNLVFLYWSCIFNNLWFDKFWDGFNINYSFDVMFDNSCDELINDLCDELFNDSCEDVNGNIYTHVVVFERLEMLKWFKTKCTTKFLIMFEFLHK